jgi:8-amino-7-oxononanoate synthase
MALFPSSLEKKIQDRIQNGQLRSLNTKSYDIDFFSNDYLGFSRNKSLREAVFLLLQKYHFHENGATGSRLISGNHPLFEEAEHFIARFHQSESALIFNSGYDANVGFWSCVPQRNDLILYDALCHASIRDGIQLSAAKSLKFKHHDWRDLEKLLAQFSHQFAHVYVVTETVFSMDGDVPDLKKLTDITQTYQAYLVLDEAHALGVIGNHGVGLCQHLGYQHLVFARIMTFGKALGCHGAVVLGSQKLKEYLVNFSRSFIYTTGLPPHAIATIWVHYQELASSEHLRLKLLENIAYFQKKKDLLEKSNPHFSTPIQTLTFQNVQKTQEIANLLQQKNIGIKAILPPTVPKGSERLRVCLHTYNTFEEIDFLFDSITQSL